jgi:hypothetical protein
MQRRELLPEFDQDKNGRLDTAERVAAREWLKKQPPRKGPGGPPGGPPGGREDRPAPQPGPQVKSADVQQYPADRPLYDAGTLRTLFLEFENPEWEAELADFYHTDVEVPATLTVDGKKYPHVGVHFRGASSYFGVRPGFKHSLNLSMDLVEPKQKLLGYKTLNLLNANDDPSLMSSVLYSRLAREQMPAPKANFVKVVINGEYWGVYANVQQFNKEFLQENFQTTKGARWKVPGSPQTHAGLDYKGDKIDDYRKIYQLKSSENDADWQALILLCKTLNQTPAAQLETALAPMLDIDSVLWFLALDNALINCDGYWIRSSDYSIYRHPNGKFHILPHDMNECFRAAGGPGLGGPPGGRGPRGPQGNPPAGGPPPGGPPMGLLGLFGPPGGRVDGVKLDPLHGMTDAFKPLRSKLLAVPRLQAKYLQNVRTIAAEQLDWKKLGPIVAQYRQLIEKDVAADTRKLGSTRDFQRLTADEEAAGPGGERHLSLRKFADERRKFLLEIIPAQP